MRPNIIGTPMRVVFIGAKKYRETEEAAWRWVEGHYHHATVFIVTDQMVTQRTDDLVLDILVNEDSK